VTERQHQPTWRSELSRISTRLGAIHEARILLEEVAGVDFATLVTRLDETIPFRDIEHLEQLLQSRLAGVPLQHIVGHWPFRNVELLVDRRALIPRPETEQVVAFALAELARIRAREGIADRSKRLRVVDLGTGSGAISCAIADEDEFTEVIAVDSSQDALGLAALNIARLRESASRRVELLRGSWYEPLADIEVGSVDCVISNPPYLREDEWQHLDPGVRDHDPYRALVSGTSGLEDLERIITTAPRFLAEQGALICEIGETQSEAVRELSGFAGFLEVEVRKDLAGRDRILIARSPHG